MAKLEILNKHIDFSKDGVIDRATALLAMQEYINQQLILHGINLSLPDAENLDFLRGFIDGYGGNEPHEVFPDGFNNINDVWDKVDELKIIYATIAKKRVFRPKKT